MPSEFLLSAEKHIKIYPYDVDYMAIVHNVVYIRWLEEMRTDMLEGVYSMADSIEAGVTPVIAELNAQYKIPLRMGNKATAKITIKEMGKIKWVVGFEINSEAGLHFSAEQTGYFYNIKLNRPSRIPKHLVELYKKATA
ncbi:MAG: hypothetical protein C0603_10130 [Denitrovibrio sp.]|nr:MAG: hypothetical protein C0603_10130 [Denitrovibrio sp.]